MIRISKTIWLVEGLAILETEGYARITVESICERMQRSKGSFYFHFKNREGYIQALMDFWMEEYTWTIIRKAQQAKDKKRVLNQLSVEKSLKLEQALRAWSYVDEMVKSKLEEADHARLESIIEVQMGEGKNQRDARDIAILTYSVLVGIQQLYPEMPNEEKQRLEALFSSKF